MSLAFPPIFSVGPKRRLWLFRGHMDRVLDTSALMDNSRAIIPENGETVLLPRGVIIELDRLKGDPRRSGRASAAIKEILNQIDSGAAIEVMDCEYPEVDTQVVEIARRANAKIVSNDFGIHIRAKIDAIECECARVSFPNVTEVYVDSERVESLYKTGRCETTGIFAPNECLLLRNLSNTSQTILGLASRDRRYIYRVLPKKPWDVSPRTMRQHFLTQVLSDPEIRIVTVIGDAGTGKTMLSCAVALDQVFDQSTYKRIFVTRPIVSPGHALGFLPGNIDEKMGPWMGATDSIFKDLINTPGSDHLMDSIIIFPLTYARGFTVKDAFWIIDEAQNFTSEQLKLLLTRAGENTKVVLAGDTDPSQSDLTAGCFGLQSVVNAFKGERIYAHVTLDKSQRGDVCRIACERM